jgi:PAS domain S-box-containing protein
MYVMKQSPLFMTSEATERPIPGNQEPPGPVMSDDKISPLKMGLLVSPVFIFGVLIILSSVIFPDKAYEPVWLLPILNLIFLIIIPYLIAVLVSIMFLKTGVLTFLLLGSSMISYGLGSFLSGIAIDYNPNITVILHNTGSLLGGLFLFICAVLSFSFAEQRLTVRNRRIKLIAVYSIIAAGLIFLFWGSSADMVPTFFTPRVGSTLIRQWVLGGGILFYEITVILFILLYTRSRQLFILIYSIALSLMGIGLLGVWFQKAVGSPMGWAGRSSQYVGAVYFLASVVLVYRKGESDLYTENILSGFFGNYLKERVEIHTAELKEAQESWCRDHSLLNSIANISPVGIVVLDREGKITFASPRAESILGLPKKQITQLTYSAPDQHITHFDGRSFPDENLPFRRVMAAGRPVFEVEHAIEWFDGRRVLLSINAAPILGPNGQGYGMVAAIEDITERKQAEEKMNHLLKEKEILFREIRHRVKNNMNSMMSLLPPQSRTLEDLRAPALEGAKVRLKSMRVLYDRFYPTENLREMSIKDYLPPLVEEIIGLFPKQSSITIETRIDDFVLGVNLLSLLGMIVNELLTNAMKYAFIGRDEGLITIAATIQDQRATLVIEDNGNGIPGTVDIEHSSGFGLRLVGMLTKQLDGTIKIERGKGTRFVLEFKSQ